MDREQFGKIRNATRSIAAQKADALDLQSPNKGLVHDAIDYLKLLRDRGGHEGKDYVEAHSDLWQERQKIGEKRWKAFTDISKEKWDIEMQGLRPKLDNIVRTSTDALDASMRFRDAVYLAISKTTETTMADPRMGKIFRGKKKKEFESMVRSFNARTKVAQEDMLRELETMYGIRQKSDD